jgi:hypothetical protein
MRRWPCRGEVSEVPPLRNRALDRALPAAPRARQWPRNPWAGRRHINLSDGDEKPLGEWNKTEITCRGDEVLVNVNGKLVNHATKLN